MKRGSVVFVSSNFPSLSDAARGHYNLSQLRALGAAGVAFEVAACRPWFPLVRSRFAMASGVDGERVDGFRVAYPRVLYIPLARGAINARLYALSLARPLLRLCRRVQPDFLWSSFVFPDGVAVSRIARRLGLPHVVSAVGSDLNLNIERRSRRSAIADCLRSTALVLAKSQALREVAIAHGARGDDVVVDYNGVDQALFRPMLKRDACAAVGADPSLQRILFVGSLSPVKNVPLLVSAFSRLVSARGSRPLELIVIGAGPLASDLRQQVMRQELGARVRFLGPRTHAEVAVWLGASDLLCLPSLAEGVPNVVLESLAGGRPVVASAVGGIPEVHPGTTCGALVTAGDEAALGEALSDTLARRFDAERLREAVSTYTWEVNAARIIDHLARRGLLAPSSWAPE